MMSPRAIMDLHNVMKNITHLTNDEMAAYGLFQQRAKRQLLQTGAYAFILLMVGIGSTIFLAPLLGNILLGVCMPFVLLAMFALFHPTRFLPFRISTQADIRIYEWKTRQLPTWLYRKHIRAGRFCLFYGDALSTERPEFKD